MNDNMFLRLDEREVNELIRVLLHRIDDLSMSVEALSDENNKLLKKLDEKEIEK